MGAGSIAEHLRRQVGPNGKVVSTDLETRFLQVIDADNLEVRKLDNTTEMVGFQLKLGSHLGDELRACGIQDVGLKGLIDEASGSTDHPGHKVVRITIKWMRSRMIDANLLSNEEFNQLLLDIAPDFHAMLTIYCSAWGSKAG